MVISLASLHNGIVLPHALFCLFLSSFFPPEAFQTFATLSQTFLLIPLHTALEEKQGLNAISLTEWPERRHNVKTGVYNLKLYMQSESGITFKCKNIIVSRLPVSLPSKC